MYFSCNHILPHRKAEHKESLFEAQLQDELGSDIDLTLPLLFYFRFLKITHPALDETIDDGLSLSIHSSALC